MKLKTHQSGFILVIALLFLSVLSLMVFSDMETAVLEAKMVGGLCASPRYGMLCACHHKAEKRFSSLAPRAE